MKKKIIFLLSFFAVIISMAQCPLTTAVDFTATDINGVQHNLFNYLNNNKYVVIDFFYTTCGPCQQTAPKVQGAYENFGCNASNVIFLSIDNGDNNQLVQQFGDTYGIHCPKISGVEGGGTAINSTYQITAFPTVIMIAPNKTIIEQDIWPIADAAYLISVVSGHGGIAMACSSTVNETPINNSINSFSIYPNPNNGNAFLNINLINKSLVSMSVYNLIGEKIKEFPSEILEKGVHKKSINFDNLDKGYYQINFYIDNNLSYSEKMLIVN